MAVKMDSLRANLKREAEGDWVPAPSFPGAEVCVRSLNYPPFQNKRAPIAKKFRQRYGEEAFFPEEEWGPQLGAIVADELLLGWRGFDVEYTPDTAAELLTDPEMRNLRNSVIMAANNIGEVQVEYIKDAGKNSQRSSDGS